MPPDEGNERAEATPGWEARHTDLLNEARRLASPGPRAESEAFGRLQSELGARGLLFPRRRPGGNRPSFRSWGAFAFGVSALCSALWFVHERRQQGGSASLVPGPVAVATTPATPAAPAVPSSTRAAPFAPPSPAARVALGRTPRRLDEGRLDLSGEAEIEVAEGSNVSAVAQAHALEVRLGAGRIALRVRHREPGDPAFSVSTGMLSFQVLGTAFTVERDQGLVALTVTEGVVAVVREGRVLARVRAGHSWRGDAAGSEATGAEGAKGEAAKAAVATSPSKLGSGPRRVALRLPAGRAAAPDRPDLQGPTMAAVSAPTPAVPTASSRRASCLALETSGQVEPAVTCYEALGAGAGVTAEAALYQAAVLRRDTQHDKEGALTAFRAYQQRFPDGVLADEVGLSVAELLPRLGRYQEALTETDRLFARGAGRERRAELLMLRGKILLDGLRDPERAEAAFAEVAADGAAAGVEALYYRGLCLQKLGRSDEAREAFTTYLARGQTPAHLRDARARLGLGEL